MGVLRSFCTHNTRFAIPSRKAKGMGKQTDGAAVKKHSRCFCLQWAYAHAIDTTAMFECVWKTVMPEDFGLKSQ